MAIERTPTALLTPGTAQRPRVVALPAGQVKVSATIRVASHVYLVAEPSTTVVWGGKDGQLLWFSGVVSGTGNLVRANKGNGLVLTGKGTSGRISKQVSFQVNGRNGVLVKTKAELATVKNAFAGDKSKSLRTQSRGKVKKI